MAIKGKMQGKELLNVLVYVLFAVIIIPIIATQIAGMISDNDSGLGTPEKALLGMLTIFIVLGVVYAIVKSLL